MRAKKPWRRSLSRHAHLSPTTVWTIVQSVVQLIVQLVVQLIVQRSFVPGTMTALHRLARFSRAPPAALEMGEEGSGSDAVL